MSFFTDPFADAFCTVWTLNGKPTMNLIQPISEWTLAAGVTYDAHNDQFIDDGGDVVTVDWTMQPYDETQFIPAKQANDVILAIPGVVTTAASDRNVVIQWTSDAAAQVAAAWGVSIGSQLYHIKKWELVPEGVTCPLEIRVTLAEGA